MVHKIQRRTREAFLLVLLVPVVLACITVLSARRYQDDLAWVSHSRVVIHAIEERLAPQDHARFGLRIAGPFPAALDRELFPWLQALYPVWARLTPESLQLGVTVAMSELLLSGCTTTTDHHYVFPDGLEDAVDIEVAVAKRLGLD